MRIMSAARTAVNDAGAPQPILSPEDTVKSRRDLLKAIGGLVLATGGSWLASHAHGADTPAANESHSPDVADAIDHGDALETATTSSTAGKR